MPAWNIRKTQETFGILSAPPAPPRTTSAAADDRLHGGRVGPRRGTTEVSRQDKRWTHTRAMEALGSRAGRGGTGKAAAAAVCLTCQLVRKQSKLRGDVAKAESSSELPPRHNYVGS